MPFLEIHLRLKSAEQPEVEAALEACGSLAITLLDAEDVPILEPGPGETPLWPDLLLTGLFPHTQDRIELLVALDSQMPEHILRTARFAEVDDKDWTRVWMDGYKPMRFGERLWIVPTTCEPPEPNAINLRLDPGLAFGTGTHPTTALCLRWLDGVPLSGKSVIDFGCGSGILAIASLLLGAASAWAIDNDPQALVATRENALRNQVAAKLSVHSDLDAPPAPADVLLANILLPPLLQLAPLMARLCKGGADAVFSGMLQGQQHEFMELYQAAFEDFAVQTEGDWIRISARRKS